MIGISFSTEFIDDGKGVIQVARGKVSGTEIIDGSLEIQHFQERTGTLRYGLVDLTDVSHLDITTENILRIVQTNVITSKLSPSSVVAIVASKDFTYGIARMWESFAVETGWKTKIFRKRDEAEIWLRDTLGSKTTEISSK
ncbi:MAG: hypothetical protein ACHQQQ_03235 [Bacteroidota bacterium]